MSTPGFTAESSLYRRSHHYWIRAGGLTTSGATAQLLPSKLPARLPLCPWKIHNYDCTPCQLDELGNCTRECECCEGYTTKDNCVSVSPFPPCSPHDCCPAGYTHCGGKCVDLSVDWSNCGSCGNSIWNWCCNGLGGFERPDCFAGQLTCRPGQQLFQSNDCGP
jgi:hypothetical protein